MGSSIRYFTMLTLWKIIYFIPNFILSIYFWGKKKTVPPIRNNLLLKSAKQIAKDIRERKLKSEDVVKTYIDRIKEVNPYINAIVQDRFDDALEDAKEIDELVQTGKFTTRQLEEEKPILGVPFTVKLLLTVKGFECSGGSKLFKDTIATEDALSVTLIKNAGGIVLATTNVPEFGLSIESTNLLYGRTCNPYDTTRTSGGSSGGESAIISAGASIIGLGNDVLGSLRIPANFTGIFSHKPSVGLVPNSGVFPIMHPDLMSFLCTGPLCRYSEDLMILMNILASKGNKKDQFNKKDDFRNLKIYFLTDNGDISMIPTDKETINAVDKAILHFTKNHGATAKKIKIRLLNKVNFMIKQLVHSAQSNGVRLGFTSLDKMKYVNGPMEFLKYFIGKSTFNLPTIGALIMSRNSFHFDEKNVPGAQQILKQIEKEFDKLLDENSIFICPTYPVAAPYLYETLTHFHNSAFGSLFNPLGFPVTNCPIQLNRNGLPIGIQIVARKNNDYLTMACAAELEKAFGGWIPPGNLN